MLPEYSPCEQVEEIGEFQPGLLNAARHWRRGAHQGVQIGGRELPEGHQVLAQDAAALRLLTLQRIGHVGWGHQTLGNQDIA